jgi:hypothetical protein
VFSPPLWSSLARRLDRVIVIRDQRLVEVAAEEALA